MEHVASRLGADPVKVRAQNFLSGYPVAPAPANRQPPGSRPAAAAATSGSAGEQAGDCVSRSVNCRNFLRIFLNSSCVWVHTKGLTK